MDISTLKTILKEEGGKVFIVGEHEDSVLVVLSLAEYRQLKANPSGSRAQESQAPAPAPVPEEPSAGLRIEDLPL